MNKPPIKSPGIQYLARVVEKEIRHLRQTDERLFATPFTREKVAQLEQDVELSERVDAFVTRFGRLQDTVGDKLLPQYLSAVGEVTGVVIDNLNRAEKLGLINSAEDWIALRNMRNAMIHEYMEDLDELAKALNRAHENVDMLSEDAKRILSDLESRGWL